MKHIRPGTTGDGVVRGPSRWERLQADVAEHAGRELARLWATR